MKNIIKKITIGGLLSLLVIPVLVKAEAPLSISIDKEPKTEYFVDEPLDIAGLVIAVEYSFEGESYNCYSDGSGPEGCPVITITESNISGFESGVPIVGQIITVTFEGKTTTYTINIVEDPNAFDKLDSILITNPATKLEYAIDEELDITGLVVEGVYKNDLDASENRVISNDDLIISGFDSSVASTTQTLTITFEGETTTYNISVVEAPVEESNSRSGGGRSGSRRVVTQAPTAPLSTAQGEVLGESTFAFNMDLSLGMSGNDVKELQERLRVEGFFTHPISTGYFGPITLAAVKAYQAAHPEIGYVTGFVGPLTRAVLNK